MELLFGSSLKLRDRYPQTRFLFVIKNILICSDLLMLFVAYFLCRVLYGFGWSDVAAQTALEMYTFYNLVQLWVIWLFSAYLFNLYRDSALSALEVLYRASWRTLALYMLLFLFVILFRDNRSNVPAWVWIYYVVLGSYLGLSRFLITYIYSVQPFGRKRVALIGNTKTAHRLKSYFTGKHTQYLLFTPDIQARNAGQEEIFTIHALEEQFKHIVSKGINDVYMCITATHTCPSVEIMEMAEKYCLHISFIANIDQLSSFNYHTQCFGDIPIFKMENERLNEIASRSRKRFFDILFSLSVIVLVLSWLLPIVALILRMESRGPIFFRQQRSGRDNKPFFCYKFRSMYVNSASDHQQARRGDRRITKVGAFLRKTSLDELPQFFNVLRGDMSTVGPRPHMLVHTEYYGAFIKKYMARHYAKPGITGWAQAHGYRGETTDPDLMQKRVEHDVWYLHNWSLMLDVRIIFMTVINMIKKDKNAY